MPPQRQVFGASLLDLEIDSPGVAEVLAADVSIRLLSVGLDPLESRLVYTEPEEASEALAEALDAPVELLNAASREGVSTAVNRARTGSGALAAFSCTGTYPFSCRDDACFTLAKSLAYGTKTVYHWRATKGDCTACGRCAKTG